MNEVQKIIAWSEAELALLFKDAPAIVKKYGAQAIQIGNTIKAALASPTAAGVEAALAQMFPGSWEATVVADLTKGLAIALPELTTITQLDSTIDMAAQFVNWLKTLSPKMQHSGVLKLISALFQALDPSLSEVAADTAAQVAYAKSVSNG